MKKTIWITGASKGIGLAIVKKFYSGDWNVVASSRSIEENFEKLDIGDFPLSINCDVSNELDVQNTVKKIYEKFGRIDVLVNNAGIGIFKSISDTTSEDFMVQINTNLLGTFLCSKNVIPYMKEQSKGIIVNVISVAAIKPFVNSGSYGASKAATLMLSRVMREELKQFNIKVISIIPGATATEIWNPKVLEKYSEKMMKPEDVADVVFSTINQPDNVITEEVILRPITGDL